MKDPEEEETETKSKKKEAYVPYIDKHYEKLVISPPGDMKMKSLLGHGATGRVTSWRHKKTQIIRAVKEIPKAVVEFAEYTQHGFNTKHLEKDLALSAKLVYNEFRLLKIN